MRFLLIGGSANPKPRMLTLNTVSPALRAGGGEQRAGGAAGGRARGGALRPRRWRWRGAPSAARCASGAAAAEAGRAAAEARASEGEALRRRLHNTILVRPAQSPHPDP